MDISEARQIITAYGDAITKLRDGDVVQPVTDLPCSPAKLKFAFFVLTDYMIKNKELSKGLAENFVDIYAMINTRFREESDSINNKYKELFGNRKGSSGINMEEVRIFQEKYGSATNPGMASPEAQVEFHNYIADCQGNY